MSCEDEVLSIRRKLEKMTGDGADQSQALDLLKRLGSMKINVLFLTSTRIGKTVNNLRKSSNDKEMITVAETLIKTWQKLIKQDPDLPLKSWQNHLCQARSHRTVLLAPEVKSSQQ